MSVDFAQLQEIFLAAVDCRHPGDRQAYLDQACAGDVELRRRVDHLLKAHQEAGALPDTLTDYGRMGMDEGLAVLPGTVIGPFKLHELIGEGGMGVVYMALQTSPVRRVVAVKVIKPGMDSRQVLARFEAERQALALMDHPNIAKVLDAGTTPEGRPYFAMELVKGVAITRFCDERRLTLRARLELFLSVCQAVQHAHQKGVIHRDLKPSNILVGLYDGVPIPKVIDFGIAKAIGQKLTEATLFTGFGAVVGTPEYMSPEQAQLENLDIDTRADVYSLGVLLYELLTGTTPLDRKRLTPTALLDVLRIIREQEPPRPSTRLSSTEEVATIAACRSIEPRRLAALVRGELDWIVMKVLEKDRPRRYPTAAGLASDIQRYLGDEPVQACPPSAAYRLRKFAQRNRGVVLVATLLILTLAGGLIGTAWGLVRAADARAHAAEQAAQRQIARRDADENRYASYLNQSRVLRAGHRPGQRFESLTMLRQATELARVLAPSDDRLRDLRDAAVATLALPDLYPTGPWRPWPAEARLVDFDEAHVLYARTDPRGNCSVRRMADDVEIHLLPGYGIPALPHFSRDGKFLAVSHYTGGPPFRPRNLELWELGPATARKVLTEDKAWAGAFHPRLPQVALTYGDGSIDLFELPDGRLIKRLPPVTLTREIGVALHPTEPVVAVHSYFASEWHLRDLRSGEVLATVSSDDRATSLAWHPDGQTLAVGLETRRIRLYDRDTLQVVRTYEGEQAVTRIEFNRDGDRLAAVGWLEFVELFDVGTGERLFATGPCAGPARFHPDGQRLTGSLRDGRLGTWQVGDGREYRTLVRQDMPERGGFYGSPTVSPDGRLVAAAMQDGIGLWDIASGGLLAFIPLPGQGIHSVVFEPSGALLTLDADGVSRWPATTDPSTTGRLVIGLPERLPLPPGNMLGQSRDGRLVVTCARATGDQEQSAGGWLLHSDQPKNPIHLDPGADVEWIAVSPDGCWVVTSTHASGQTKIWNARDGRLVKHLAEFGAGNPQFSPDGRWLSTDLDGGRLLAVGTWEPGPRLGGDGTFAPDSALVAVPVGSTIRLADPATGRTLVTLEDPNMEPIAGHVVFTPDGTRLIGINNGKAKGIRVWNLRLVRQHLAEMGLDWAAPPYPPTYEDSAETPLKIEVRTSPPLSREARIRHNIEEYRRHLKTEPRSPMACNNLAWVLSTAPEPLRDVETAVHLAERAVRLEPDNAGYTNTLGVAYYRAGRYRDAVDALRPNLDRQEDRHLALDLYILAMSHHRLGESTRARIYYDWASRWERAQPDRTAQEIEDLNRFRAEAAELLEIAQRPDDGS